MQTFSVVKKNPFPRCVLVSCVVIFPIHSDLSDFLYPEFPLIKRGQGQTLVIWTARWTKKKITFLVKVTPQPKFHRRIQLERLLCQSSSLAKQMCPCRQKPHGSLLPGYFNGPTLVDGCVQTHHDMMTIEPMSHCHKND